MQKNRFSNLSTSIKSKGRFNVEKKSNLRSPYQRDRDRIIHSTAFRRLKHKTQVFVNTTGDHYRTRITHSLEVSQIARTLAIQTIRIVTLLENRYYNFKGLNLTIETLDGLIKHNGPVYNLAKFDGILGKNFFKKKINFQDNPSLEAQIASISDDIAYNSHDLEDGLRAKLFKLNDLKDLPIINLIIKKHRNKFDKFSIDLVLRQVIREVINEMVKDIILNTKKNLKKNNIGNIKDIYKLQKPIVCFSENMSFFDTSIKNFLKKKMYFHKNVIHKTNFGKKVIKKLFMKIKKNPNNFIHSINKKEDNLDREICDFIAGMTDRFAINLYNKLK